MGLKLLNCLHRMMVRLACWLCTTHATWCVLLSVVLIGVPLAALMQLSHSTQRSMRPCQGCCVADPDLFRRLGFEFASSAVRVLWRLCVCVYGWPHTTTRTCTQDAMTSTHLLAHGCVGFA